MEKLRVNDEVLVLAGKNKGKSGKVLRIFRKRNRVVVEGINLVKKNLKATQENPDGGIVEQESAIHISNIGIMSAKTKKPTRVKIEKNDGKNVRVSVACKTVLS